MELSKDDKLSLLQIARSSIERVIAGKPDKLPNNLSPNLLTPCGAFVTLKVKKTLRGCIGYVEAKKTLHQTVREVAVKAAKDDPRFFPLTKRELDILHIEISVLSSLQPIAASSEIEIGKHGIYVIREHYRGLLLPQVATEMKWNAEEFLNNTSMKAGLKPDAWKDTATKVFTFSAEIFSEHGLVDTVL
jgi:AmmeMemoRadiSam system protein A